MISSLFVPIGQIPATFWGVIVGSFLSLGGVIISNRANDHRLRAQLEHDRKLKTRERELSLRTELYLAAADAIASGIDALAKFSDLATPPNRVTAEYSAKASAISKVYVIAGDETMAALTALVDSLSTAFLRLHAKRLPLLGKQQQMQALGEQLRIFQSECSNLLELMKQHNLKGDPDQRRWDVIQQNFQFEQKRIADTSNMMNSLGSALYTDNLSFMQECVVETSKIRRLLIPALTAVRKELELPFDKDGVVAVFEESIKMQERLIADFINQIGPSREGGANP